MMERPTPPETTMEAAPGDAEPVEMPEADDMPAAEPSPAKGRGVGNSKAGRTGGVKGKKVKPRTVYLPDDLFERVWLQAHRKDMTISEYVTWALSRQVPGPRAARDADDTAA
jgi:hypothetical protein